jgi:hypothetical protein
MERPASLPFAFMKTLLSILLFLSPMVAHAQTIVGFDLSRGGSYNLEAQSGVRTAISDALPNARFTYTGSLSGEVLAEARGLVIMSPFSDVSAVTALSTTEKTALTDFVKAGGFAVILSDNNSSDGWTTTNNSFVSPFGVATTGSFNAAVSIIDPTGNPISNGPFGLVTSLTGVAQGAFTTTPEAFKPLAQLSGGQQIVAGYFEQNALGTGSGAVLFVGDANVYNAGWATAANYDLLSNFVTFATVPEPTTVSLLLLGSGIAGLSAWRRRRR